MSYSPDHPAPAPQTGPGGLHLSPLSPQERISERILGWGLFWRLLCSQAGSLFLLAAVICFFAFNWASMPAFTKFGLLGACMAASGGLAVKKGFLSTSGGLGLLACGLLAGVLLAVFGQVYQTGANAWELFRAWTLFLLPLALLGRRSGLWFTLWITANLWAGFYLLQNVEVSSSIEDAQNYLLFIILGQYVFFIAWEAAAWFFASPERSFLHSRWVPRCIGFALLLFITNILAVHISDHNMGYLHTPIYTLLFAGLLAGGAWWYTRYRRDLFLIASGLFGLLVILLTLLIRLDSSFPSIGGTILIIVTLIAYAAASGKLLIALNNYNRVNIEPGRVTNAEAKAGSASNAALDPAATAGQQLLELPAHDFSPDFLRFTLQGRFDAAHSPSGPDKDLNHEGKARSRTPWVAQLLMGISAWIAVPFTIALFALLFTNASTGTFIVLSFLLLGAGLMLSRAPGVFTAQASLCLCLTGAVAASILIPMEYRIRTMYLAPAIAIFALSALLNPTGIYRCLASGFALSLSFLQAEIALSPFYFAVFAERQETATTGFGTVLIDFTLAFSLLAACLAKFWDEKERVDSAFLLGALGALLVTGIIALLGYSGGITQALSYMGFTFIGLRTAGVGAGIGLFIFARKRLAAFSLPRPVALGVYLMCAAITLVSYRLPWLGIGFFTLALARQAGSLPLLGVGIVYLALGTIVEYYYLGTSLLKKAYSLGAIGALLCLAAWFLHRQLSGAVQSGALPAPVRLIHHDLDSTQTAGSEKKKDKLRPAAFALCLLGFFLLFGQAVLHKQNVIANGKQVILALRPVDPRSLMQGDYMTLYLDIETAIYNALSGKNDSRRMQGVALAVPDAQGVYGFAGLADETGSTPASAVKLVYRGASFGVRMGPGSFFFQEGHGQQFNAARYAELRVDDEGNTLITHLLDENRQRIEPGKQNEQTSD